MGSWPMYSAAYKQALKRIEQDRDTISASRPGACRQVPLNKMTPPGYYSYENRYPCRGKAGGLRLSSIPPLIQNSPIQPFRSSVSRAFHKSVTPKKISLFGYLLKDSAKDNSKPWNLPFGSCRINERKQKVDYATT